jgi:YaiO family outer membrane protein
MHGSSRSGIHAAPRRAGARVSPLRLAAAVAAGLLLMLGSGSIGLAEEVEATSVDPSSIITEGPQDQKIPPQVSVSFSRSEFSDTFDPWNFISLDVGGKPFGFSMTGRVNYANRFEKDGVQFEVDAYPRLRDGTYAYLNAGYSGSTSLFPEYRAGAEVFQSLPKSFEASLGFRHLRFTSSNVTLYTGSISKYYRSYYISLRPYYRSNDVGSSNSVRLMIRKYLSDPKYYATFADWISVSMGVGSSPEEDVSTLEQFRLDSQNISVDWRKRIGGNRMITAGVGYEREEVARNEYRSVWSFGVGFRVLMMP